MSEKYPMRSDAPTEGYTLELRFRDPEGTVLWKKDVVIDKDAMG